MDIQFLRKFGEMELLFDKKQYKECEQILSTLIKTNNHHLTPTENEYNVLLIKKRIIVNHSLKKPDRVLADVQLLEEMNVTIDWTDELLFVKQESIMNMAIEQVSNNLGNCSCDANEYVFEPIKHTLKSMPIKHIFDPKKMIPPQQKKTKLANY